MPIVTAPLQVAAILALAAIAPSAIAQITEATAAPVVLARATFAGSLDAQTTFSASIRLEERTISKGHNERWVLLDGTATTDGISYKLDLELSVPIDIELDAHGSSDGTTLTYSQHQSDWSADIETTITPVREGDVVIVSVDDLASDFHLTGAVTDDRPHDMVSPEEAFQNAILLTLVSNSLGAPHCEPAWTTALDAALDTSISSGLESFTYSCNAQTGTISLNWTSRDNAN